MELTKLYKSQFELDEVVAKKLNILSEFNNVEYTDKRVFALKVELAELANEVAWFKYWKQSHVMDKEKTIEELADVMHFLLSVGNSRRYNFITHINPKQWDKVPLGRLFCYLMENNYESAGKWLNAFEHLICIGYKLGFTDEEMLQAYRDKNEKNHVRQRSGY